MLRTHIIQLLIGENGSDSGGKGGNGISDDHLGAGGGAGNPGGRGARGSGWDYGGTTGTGGLLILYANSIENNGSITSNGSNGGYGDCGGGGGSGGGSINLFYRTNITTSVITANAGLGGASNRSYSVYSKGGDGGAGCVTIGNISTRTFVIE